MFAKIVIFFQLRYKQGINGEQNIVFFMKTRVSVPKFIPLSLLHLASFGYTLFAGYFLDLGYGNKKASHRGMLFPFN